MAGPTVPVASDAKAPKGEAADDDDGSRMTLLGAVLVALSATSGLLFGYDTGVVSGAMLLVRHSMALTDVWHEAIVGSTIGAAWVCSLFGGYLTDRMGRKRTILAAAAFFLAGSVVMGLASGRVTLLTGRVVVGAGVGLASMSTPMYIAECCAPRHRGMLVMLYTLGITSGQFAAGLVCGVMAEAREGWRWMLGLGALPALLVLLGFALLPESPRYLVAQGRADEAERVLRRLRGADAPVHRELKGIREACEGEEQRRKEEDSGWVLGRIWRTKHARRALVLGCAVQAYQQLAGINTAMYYSATIFRMAGIGNNSTAIWLSAGVAGVNCACTLVGMLFVDRVGRRPLLLGSLFGAAVSLGILGAAFLMMDHAAPVITEPSVGGACALLATCADCTSPRLTCGFCALANGSATCWARDVDAGLALAGPCAEPLGHGAEWAVDYCPSGYSWLAVLGLVVYLFFFAPGMGPVPWLLNAEVHALWARDVSSSLATSCNWITNLTMSFTFLSLIGLVTAAGAFFIYAGVAMTGVVLLWFIMPETKGVKLEDIEVLFGKEPDGPQARTVK